MYWYPEAAQQHVCFMEDMTTDAVYAHADILAGRKTVGEILGSVKFAGHKPSQQFLRRYTGYVEQFGMPLIHAPHL